MKQALPGHLPAFLKNRLRGLTRQQTGETATNLHDKVQISLNNMRLGKNLAGTEGRSSVRESRLKKAQERNADLIQYYQDLISRG